MTTNSLFKKPAVLILETIGNTLWGFKPNLMKHFVDQHGPVKAVSWFAGNMPKYERILKEWGPIRTHLIASAISLINGCPYCTHGHAYAFQLHYLKERGAIFPLSDEQIFALHKEERQVGMARLEKALLDAGLSEELPTLRRMVELYDDPSLTQGKEDEALIHLINMFATLNQCGIRANAEIDQVHDPINRDMALRARYDELRTQTMQTNKAE